MFGQEFGKFLTGKMLVYSRVYKIVQQIPKGKVLTYGVISHLMNSRLSAAGVGWALQALPPAGKAGAEYSSANVPWHRVINSKGGISTNKMPTMPPGLQKAMLEKEGVKFKDDETVDLGKYLWKDYSGLDV